MEARVSLITLGVADLEKSTAFYETVLGWTRAPGPPTIAFFDLNGVVLALLPHADLAAETGEVAAPGPRFESFALAHNVGSREAVDAIFASLARHGATIVKRPVEQHWGGYSGYFVDLDGHKWEVAHNPFWKIGVDGRISMG